MNIIHNSIKILVVFACIIMSACGNNKEALQENQVYFPDNVLDYHGVPDNPTDRKSLVFSDQGAWFGYGLPETKNATIGFTGPFLMTQENGVWCSQFLSQMKLTNSKSKELIDLKDFHLLSKSYPSHLEQIFYNEQFRITQKLYFCSPHTALISTNIENLLNENMTLEVSWTGDTFLDGLRFEQHENEIRIHSDKSEALGIIQFLGNEIKSLSVTDTNYALRYNTITILPNTTQEFKLSHSFIFPEYSIEKERKIIAKSAERHSRDFINRINEKKSQLNNLYQKLDTTWTDTIYKNLVSKTLLTLQNNWRIASGELEYSGIFPSYHYKWFHGFWAWDSWKHAAAVALYDPELATQQIKAMYDFQTQDGFIADCVFRDTTIENHNYRNTKPPLSAWAIWQIYKQSENTDFIKEMYPKICKQHDWWYQNRDHDQDGICEYGSTDGTLIAAKWESGMDNAVRFDKSKIEQNSENAFSLNQESVDLNAYLYAEKRFLFRMANVLSLSKDTEEFDKESEELKEAIQNQFFDEETGWFYDTSLSGNMYIKAMGCEGWIPLWAEVATPEQAESVMERMQNPALFNTKVPFQTLSANHPKFEPDGGYWRGPNWLDQAYFGVKGLHNYGYHEAAYVATKKLIHNADGVLAKGKSIRENYHPITGEGLEARSFSWSAVHYLLLLVNE